MTSRNDRHEKPVPQPVGDAAARPRLWWLALCQVIVTVLVVLLARLAPLVGAGPAILEDQLSTLSSRTQPVAPLGAADGRGWLVAVVAMVGALLLMVPTAWAYVVTHIDEKKKYDRSVVQTLLILPIAVAATLVIVQDSLAVAFSLAGIATAVRFRNALEDTKDAVYIFVAIAVGLGAGVGALKAGAALSALFNLVVVALWKWHTARPAIAEIALGDKAAPDAGSVLAAILPGTPDPSAPPPAAEWFAAEERRPLLEDGTPVGHPNGGKGKSRIEGMLKVNAIPDAVTRQSIEEVLGSRAKRWSLEAEDRDPEGGTSITYYVRLKKSQNPHRLLDELRERLGGRLAELHQHPKAGQDKG